MRMSALMFFFAALFTAHLASAAPVLNETDPETLIGRKVPNIHLLDDEGRPRRLAELAGSQPLILLPMYTNCQSACLLNTHSLKEALADLDIPANQYRVLLFSFDAKETPESLHRFRERENLPLPWTLATSDRKGIEDLMESIAFRFADANGQFMHPNRVAFLTRDLRIARFLYGSKYPTARVKAALKEAMDPGRMSFLRRYGKYAFGLLLFLATLLAVYLVVLLIELKKARAPSSPASS